MRKCDLCSLCNVTCVHVFKVDSLVLNNQLVLFYLQVSALKLLLWYFYFFLGCLIHIVFLSIYYFFEPI